MLRMLEGKPGGQAVPGAAMAFIGRGGLVVAQQEDADRRRQGRLIAIAGDQGDDLVHALAFALAIIYLT